MATTCNRRNDARAQVARKFRVDMTEPSVQCWHSANNTFVGPKSNTVRMPHVDAADDPRRAGDHRFTAVAAAEAVIWPGGDADIQSCIGGGEPDMLNVHVGYIAVLAAGVAAWIVGALWYGVLGKRWMSTMDRVKAQLPG